MCFALKLDLYMCFLYCVNFISCIFANLLELNKLLQHLRSFSFYAKSVQYFSKNYCTAFTYEIEIGIAWISYRLKTYYSQDYEKIDKKDGISNSTSNTKLDVR